MPGANCLLGICCPPGSPQQRAALAKDMAEGLGWKDDEAKSRICHEVAAWVLGNYDLAPHDSLREFKAEIARLARENP